ncbi:hypothetical protein [Arthrobacter sp. CJ23]|uniref:hypothetical protein n=1 Tax=Arthrobacter sp. CJ23 TaxID=2972479 RepID=UPI00215CA305|nr:hypothetical protein [Arthrobacter sp. CJ23]UVJ40770.1 hypothetical protein NVV90_06260 [Arthrobacter sp. CJ23]
MTTISATPAADNADRSRGRPWCSGCRSDAHLMVDGIAPVRPLSHEAVDLSYTCLECDSFYAHPVAVDLAAAIMDHRGIVSGVLHFDGDYFHCGEPMKMSAPELPAVYAATRLQDPPGNLGPSKVLRCRCGFRLELPPEGNPEPRQRAYYS